MVRGEGDAGGLTETSIAEAWRAITAEAAGMSARGISEVTVKVGKVLVVGHADDGTGMAMEYQPGWQISGVNWMISRRDLPDDWPPLARAACELLRALEVFTPQQAACAKAAIEELMG